MDPEFLEHGFIHDLIESGELDGLGLVDPDEREAYYGDAETAKEHGPGTEIDSRQSCLGVFVLFTAIICSSIWTCAHIVL